MIAPQDEPDFLTAERYLSQSFTDFLSGQKKGFFLISFYVPIISVTRHQTKLNYSSNYTKFFSNKFFKTIFAIPPAATLEAVSLADCLPPPR